jgi:hypothetical protein
MTKCETCGEERELVFGLCAECVRMDAYPLEDALAYSADLKAEWEREVITYKDGRYMTVAEALEVSRE